MSASSLRFLRRLAPLLLVVFGSVLNRAQVRQAIASNVVKIPSGFRSGNVNANGTTLHYVRGGTGPAVILLHGFPEDWYEFRLIMPRLAKTFTVVAVDLRGVGQSAPSPTGYDAANLAEDIHQLAAQLKLEQAYLVGHDIGGMVAYAFVRLYPQTARGAMILDVAFPGLDPWQEILANPAFWHIRFHQTDLPGKILAGRQQIYFRYFLSSEHFRDADVTHYADSYRDPDHLRTAFEFYRAFPADAKFYTEQRNPIALPIVLGVGETDAFAPFLPRIAEAMRAQGCTHVKTEIVEGSAHYVVEERPQAVAELIERYPRPE